MTPAQLRQARKDAGLNQEQWARKLKAGLPTIKTWEGLAARGEDFGPRQQVNADLRYEYWKGQGND